ncbi:MAG: hypothetical protein ACXW27_07390 [Allosphingosinicella sp.]
METLAEVVTPLLDGDRTDDIGQLLAELEASLVSLEAANKGMPDIRKSALAGIPSVITRMGRSPDENATVVIALHQLAGLFGQVFAGGERKGVERRAPDAILARLKPIDFDFGDLRIPRRTHEETLGGRTALTLD